MEEKQSPLEEVTKNYSQLCAELGQAQYIIKMHEERMKELVEELKKVNKKADYLKVQRELQEAKDKAKEITNESKH